MSDERDDQIAAGLGAGRREAWSALYEAHFERVWRLVARLVGTDAAAVADVVQETFLAAARSVRTFDPGRGSPWLWLAGIARNHAGTYFRSRRRDGRLTQGGDLRSPLVAEWARRIEAGTKAPPDTYASAETAGFVRAALGRLPDDYQSLLTARYCDDLSVDEIAKCEGCSVTAIRSRLARARRAFREVFGGCAAPRADAETGARDGDG